MVTYEAAEEIKAVLAKGGEPWLSMEMHTSGGVYAWGQGTSGQLGLSGIENQSFPIRSENALTQEENFFANRPSYVAQEGWFCDFCDTWLGHVMYNDSTTPDTEKSFKAVVSGKWTMFSVAVRSRNTFGVFVICDNDQCYAEYILWYGRIHGERRTRGAPAPAPLMYPDAALLLVLARLMYRLLRSRMYWNASQSFCLLHGRWTKGQLDLCSVRAFPG